MCKMSATTTPAKQGGVNLGITCETSGKPINVSNKYGMFCEDLCGLQESKDAMKKLKAMMKGLMP